MNVRVAISLAVSLEGDLLGVPSARIPLDRDALSWEGNVESSTVRPWNRILDLEVGKTRVDQEVVSALFEECRVG